MFTVGKKLSVSSTILDYLVYTMTIIVLVVTMIFMFY